MSVAGSLIAPTLATACAALPPEGALLAWGGPALRRITPTLATTCAALPPEGALAPWGGPAALDLAPTRTRGFTLLELLVVIAIISVGTAAVALAIPDSNATALEREAQRVAAMLEAGRSQSRTTGLILRWQPSSEGFTFRGPVASEADIARPWLESGTTAQASQDRPFVLLGPEPIIPAQSVTLSLAGRSIEISTDGLRPFRIRSGPPDGEAGAAGER